MSQPNSSATGITGSAVRSHVQARGLDGRFDAIVVGGGFYGARLALLLRSQGARVLLLEREQRLLARASYANQARVHHGYHYPRSILTALRARVHYERFRAEYPECIVDCFTKYYAIARRYSHITAAQFSQFCQRIGASLSPAPREVAALFDDRYIEGVFAVQECAFDATRLGEIVESQLARAGVDVLLGVTAERYEATPTGCLVLAQRGDEPLYFHGDLLLNCTYGSLNELLRASGDAPLTLKHEITELALVEVPPELAAMGVTVMDGPFFSLMPFPARGLHSLSHVRYTPHASWQSTDAFDAEGERRRTLHGPSRAEFMIRDAARLMPAIRGCRHVDSLWEVKTVLPRSESNDSRPILLHRHGPFGHCFSVLGAKIDSVYDVEAALVDALDAATMTA